MTEAQLQTKIIKYLDNNDFYTIKTIKLNKNGLPDIFAFKDSKTIMIEVKREGKKPNELQKYRIEEVKKYGVFSFWVDNFEQFKKIIVAYMK
jgi:Holliday junction resolvase